MNHPTHPVEQEEVMAYLDGELTAARAAEMAAHLNGCAECRALADDLRGVSQRMLTWQVEPAPAQLETSIAEAAAKPRKQSPIVAAKPSWWNIFAQRPVWQRWAVVLSTLAIVAFMGRWLQLSIRQSPLPVAQRTSIQLQAGAVKKNTEVVDGATFGRNGSVASGDKALQQRLDQYNASDKLEKDTLLYVPRPGLTMYDGQTRRDSNSGRVEQTPMVARTASLTIVVKDFAGARASVEQIVRQFNGYIGELTTESPKGSAQSLTATLRIPAPQLDTALMQLKALGRVELETQGGEEVSEQHADLVARLKNARATEQRLLDVLRQRTGKVGDILQVEQEIANTRQQIERMEAEQKGLEKRVEYGTVQLRANEDYKEELNFTPPSTLASLHNAATNGYRTLVESLLGVVLWFASYAPVLAFWALLLFWPTRMIWRRLRAGRRQTAAV
jgi:hypothetical protein